MRELAEWRETARQFAWQGHRIAYWTSGADRPPLLLLHGFPTASWDWHAVWEPLAERHRLIACDMLGFGLSAKPEGGYSLHAQADLQFALLDHLGVGEADVLAHDYGVSVAQEMLARQNAGVASARLRSIYFLNGGLIPGEHRPRLIQRIGAGPFGWIVGRLMNRRRFGKSFGAVFGPDTQPSETEMDTFWTLVSEGDGHRKLHRLLHYMHDRAEHRDRWVDALREADIPLGILNGALDPVSGRHLFEAAMREAPNLKGTVLSDVGHYPQVEAPERVVAAYRTFAIRAARRPCPRTTASC